MTSGHPVDVSVGLLEIVLGHPSDRVSVSREACCDSWTFHQLSGTNGVGLLWRDGDTPRCTRYTERAIGGGRALGRGCNG